MTVHQTFVRLVHETTGQEIFFVAEADSSDQYKFTLDVGTTGKDSFNNLSGKYRITLVVGDRAMQVCVVNSVIDRACHWMYCQIFYNRSLSRICI